MSKRIRHRRPTAFPTFAALASLAALLSLGAAAPAHAQVGAAARVAGQVREAGSGNALGGVLVELVDLEGGAVLTGDDGRFLLSRVPSGQYALRVSRLGYQTIARWATISDSVWLDVELAIDPILMQGLTVTVDRLAERRRAAAVSVRVHEFADLAAGSGTASDHVMRRAGRPRMSCPATAGGPLWTGIAGGSAGGLNCVWRRGRATRVSVYIDDRPVVGGLEDLDTYAPWDFYLVEVYGSGTMVRAYTHRFFEQLMRRPAPLMPIF